MITLIFSSFFLILILLGFSMVVAYSAAFILPSLITGGSLYGMQDIVLWLLGAARDKRIGYIKGGQNY